MLLFCLGIVQRRPWQRPSWGNPSLYTISIMLCSESSKTTECRCSCLARLARQLSPSSHLQRACDIDMADPSSNSRQWDGRRRRDEEVRGAMHHIMHKVRVEYNPKTKTRDPGKWGPEAGQASWANGLDLLIFEALRT